MWSFSMNDMIHEEREMLSPQDADSVNTYNNNQLHNPAFLRNRLEANASMNPRVSDEPDLGCSLESVENKAFSLKLFTTSDRCLAVLGISAVIPVTAIYAASSTGVLAIWLVAVLALTYIASVSS